ncbi:hypothetical protein [Metabacillus iocasae]|uniref:Uncharacterized protein n=1 Tax=Priestia iocasae TaxID=2291674 RepID=A0ABS2QWR2_9BACI|nr:hypothetical protein [Metabacillus iocasae]MBM7703835.1 hypothetical protein [Metabacillus iocasae]
MKLGDHVMYNKQEYKIMHIYRNGTCELLATTNPNFKNVLVVELDKLQK